MAEKFSATDARRAPFVPSSTFRRPAESEEIRFAARHFAIRRADFILKEYAKKIDQDDIVPTLSGESEVTGLPSGVAEVSASHPLEGISAGDVGAVPSVDVERLAQEAEARGRAAAVAEMAGAVESAIRALNQAGDALASAQLDFERRMVVPVAKSCISLAEQIARMALSTPEGLETYLQAVVAPLESLADVAEVQGSGGTVFKVRLNPADITTLKSAGVALKSLVALPDDTVSVGGAVVSLDDRVIDDRFENRVQEIRESVLAAAAELLRSQPK